MESLDFERERVYFREFDAETVNNMPPITGDTKTAGVVVKYLLLWLT